MHFYILFFSFVWSYSEAIVVLPSHEIKKPSLNISHYDNSSIPLFHYGNKSYFLGVFSKLDYLEADQACRNIKMNLVSIQSAEELYVLGKYVQKRTKQIEFWSSGTKLLDGKNWIWLSILKVVDYFNWLPGEPNNKSEFCIDLVVKNKKLLYKDENCDRKIAFICERNSSQEQEHDRGHHLKHSSLFNNRYVSPNINLLHYGRKNYYISNNFKASYLQASQICQLLRMQLVSINSKEENDRLYKYIRSTLVGDRFWTSGSNTIDGKTWIWLASGKVIDYTNWKSGQPDHSNERCLEVVQDKNKGLLWNNLDCDKKIDFICESYSNYPCKGNVIPSSKSNWPVPVIESNYSIGAISNYQGGALLHGVVVDGIIYRFSKIKADQIKASYICRQYKLELISLLDKNKNSIITNLISKFGGGDKFWTSGEKQSNGKWIWSNLHPVVYANWAPKEPNGKEELCIQVNSDGKWHDQKCDTERYFICQSSNSSVHVDFYKNHLQPIAKW